MPRVHFERVLMIQGTLVCLTRLLVILSCFHKHRPPERAVGSGQGRELYESLCVFPVDERVRLHVLVPFRERNDVVMVDHFNHERETSWTHAENRKSL